MTLVPILKKNVCKGYISQIKNVDMIYIIKLLDVTLRVIIDKSHVQQVKKTLVFSCTKPQSKSSRKNVHSHDIRVYSRLHVCVHHILNKTCS